MFQSIIFNLTHGSQNSVDFSDSTVFALVTNMRFRKPSFTNVLLQYLGNAAPAYMDPLVNYPDSWAVLWHNEKRFHDWQNEMLNAA